MDPTDKDTKHIKDQSRGTEDTLNILTQGNYANVGSAIVAIAIVGRGG